MCSVNGRRHGLQYGQPMTQALNDMIDTLRKLGGSDLVNEIAKEAAPLVDEATKSTAKAGQSPTGTPWVPRKKDGVRALAGVESKITTAAYGPIVRQTLTGGAVYAQFGAHSAQREVIPSGGAEIPVHVNDALQKAAQKVFDRVTGVR
jgi:hypothetical protein